MVKIEIIPESIELIKLTDEEYFSNKYKDYISNSKLSLLNPDEEGSIEKFELGFESKFSDSFELGGAVHAIVLQPDEYIISDLHKPSGKLGIFVTEVLNYRKKGFTLIDSFNEASKKSDYYSSSLTSTRLKKAIKTGLPFYLKRYKKSENKKIQEIYLSKSNFDKYKMCLTGISENIKFQNLIKPEGFIQDPEVFNEFAIFCEANVFFDDVLVKKIKLKSKLDNFTIDHESKIITLNDLKTTGKPVNFFMGSKIKKINDSGEEELIWIPGSFQKYRYYRQMGMYLWMLQSAIKHIYKYDYKYNVNMLVVETIPNFKSKVYKVPNSSITKGLNELKQLLIYYAKESK